MPESIQNLRQLKRLYLSGLGLDDLPEWLAHLDLEDFSANYNKLTAASVPWLGGLKRLKYLDLSSNPLGAIPDSVFELSSLEGLYVMHCGLRDVPARILQLRRLKTLELYANNIQSLQKKSSGKD